MIRYDYSNNQGKESFDVRTIKKFPTDVLVTRNIDCGRHHLDLYED